MITLTEIKRLFCADWKKSVLLPESNGHLSVFYRVFL